MNIELMKESTISFPCFLVLIAKKHKLTLEDFILLTYFWNSKEELFNVSLIEGTTKLSESDILTSFNNLMSKKIIALKTKKDMNGKIVEYINLDAIYQEIAEMYQVKSKKKEEKDVYSIFESEFGRTFSSIEYEMIKSWIEEKGFSEEMILGALKEAVWSGANNLRYIDTILHDWARKGYKTMEEVRNQNNFKRKERENVQKELFDYNWLDDDNER